VKTGIKKGEDTLTCYRVAKPPISKLQETSPGKEVFSKFLPLGGKEIGKKTFQASLRLKSLTKGRFTKKGHENVQTPAPQTKTTVLLG